MIHLQKGTPTAPFSDPAYCAEEGMVLCMDKPLTWTSADIVRKVRFRLQKKWQQKKVKVGHAGTLDPLATGVLLLCIGKATKVSDLYQAQVKEYVATFHLGATTPSFDLEKEIDATYPWEHITRNELDRVLEGFLGTHLQAPPVYSAKVVEGIRAYEYMRQGLEMPELKQQAITLYELEVLEFAPPEVTLRIKCSKGTYIRALARDLGLALHSGAYLQSLRRTQVGDIRVEDCLSLDDFLAIF